MCVEAAVCYALGLPHGDEPGCVSPVIRALKIRLNDSKWSSNSARARGLRKLAVLQLGTKDGFDNQEFVQRVVKLATEMARRAKTHAADNAAYAANAAAANAAYAAYAAYAVANAAAYADANAANAANAAANAADYRRAAAANAADYLRAVAYAANAANAAAYAAVYAADAAAAGAAQDAELQFFSDGVADILIEMNVPGVQWLPLLNQSLE